MKLSDDQSPPSLPTEKLTEFARRHRLRELAVFGSVLRGDFGPESDVDILFELQDGDELTLERLMAMQQELEAIVGRRVDLVQKRLVQNPYRRAAILNTRRVLYAA